MKFQLVISYY